MFSIEKKINRKKNLYNRREKKIQLNVSNNIEEQDKEFTNYFHSSIETKKKLLKTLKNKEKIKNLEEEIAALQEGEKEYNLKVGHILFNYETLKESKEDTREKQEELTIEYFSKLHLPLPKNVSESINSNTVYKQYNCLSCDTFNCRIINNDYDFVCINCGDVLKEQSKIMEELDYVDIDTKENFTIKGANSEVSYERRNYFNTWLLQLQGNPTINIPDKVFEDIIRELDKINYNYLDYNLMRSILKKTDNQKYYENINFLITSITGRDCISIPYDVERIIKSMFELTEYIWESEKPDERNNFFPCSYIIKKFCDIIDFKLDTRYLPELKSREKIYRQDITWKKICEKIEENSHLLENNDILKNVKWRFKASV